MNIYLPIILLVIINIIQFNRRRIINKFYQTEALSLAAAKTFNEVGVADRVHTKILVYRGIIKEAGNGRYFLDQSRIDELEQLSLTYLKYITGAAILFLMSAAMYYLLR